MSDKTLAELFREDPLEISEEDFVNKILPYFRKRRVEYNASVEKTGSAPRGVRKIEAPKDIDLSDLGI
jgi:hypothetical protein